MKRISRGYLISFVVLLLSVILVIIYRPNSSNDIYIELALAVTSSIFSFIFGYKGGDRKTTKQKQKAGDNAKQVQIGGNYNEK